jgi:hypothetical protein|tara:strand:- start:352 stop:822 length:471 start_codon:yes stop_codon:yes gene_type:complete
MAKIFVKIDNSETTLPLRDTGSITGKQVLNSVLFDDDATVEFVESFQNDGHSYVEAVEGEHMINGFYIPAMSKFTNHNSYPNTWKLDGTTLIYGPPEPWPMIDQSLSTDESGNEYDVIWEEDPMRLIRKQIDSEGDVITPEVVQVYNTSSNTWENE